MWYLRLLQREDPMEFASMLRMDSDTYHWLLEKVAPLIQREDTHYRKAIPADQKLSITLTYLAVGKMKS